MQPRQRSVFGGRVITGHGRNLPPEQTFWNFSKFYKYLKKINNSEFIPPKFSCLVIYVMGFDISSLFFFFEILTSFFNIANYKKVIYLLSSVHFCGYLRMTSDALYLHISLVRTRRYMIIETGFLQQTRKHYKFLYHKS